MTEIAIASSFLVSSAGLASNDRARVLDFLGKFQTDPRSPGLHLEKLNAAAPGIRSARITRGLRAILYNEGDRFIMLYAGQHEEAYAWAERKSVQVHPQTGVLQIVEAVEEVERRLREVPEGDPAPQLFPHDRFDDSYLLSLGTPDNWLPTLRMLRTEDQLLEVVEKLPEEVAERLLDLADGKTVAPPVPVPLNAPLSASTDNLRRFWVVGEANLAAELEKPLEAWLRFLHPSQREIATRASKGPLKVTGSAGTGKTVVAMHRARHLASQGRRVLLTSFVTTLCRNLERNLRLLCEAKELERIRVGTVHAEALRLVQAVEPSLRPIDDDALQTRLEAARRRHAPELSADFVVPEWNAVIAPNGIDSWDGYRDVERRGRGRALSVRERKRAWQVFAATIEDLSLTDHLDWPGLCRRGLELLEGGRVTSPYDAVIVDEVQDLRPIEIRLLAALAGPKEAAPELTLVGDAGQRIYPGGFSLRALGIETRGRSHVLRINYRTTEQIRQAADRLLGQECDDLDGGKQHRDGTRSLLQGPAPSLHGFKTEVDEATFIADQISELVSEGLSPGEVAVFARTSKGLDAIEAALGTAGTRAVRLARDADGTHGESVNLGSMHRAKGLEFKVVFVAGCAKGTLPLRSVLQRVRDPADRDAVIARERSLLYVSLTRARDQAFVTWSGVPSPLLNPLMETHAGAGT